jgi:surface polysaccharide O-acyltransferase-like enzyme
MELIFASFFLFFFEIFNQMYLFNRILSEVLKVDLKDRRLWKGYQILWMDEKTNQTIKTLFIRPKNLILFLGFDF